MAKTLITRDRKYRVIAGAIDFAKKPILPDEGEYDFFVYLQARELKAKNKLGYRALVDSVFENQARAKRFGGFTWNLKEKKNVFATVLGLCRKGTMIKLVTDRSVLTRPYVDAVAYEKSRHRA